MSQTRPKLVAVCEAQCSLDEERVGKEIAAVVIEMREAGAGAPAIHKRISGLGYTGHQNSVGRHLKHLRPVEEGEPLSTPGQKVGDVEILDSIISAGFKNSRNWKPTIKDTLDAMKLKSQLTGNSAFADLITLFDGADDPDEEFGEAPEAIFSPEELSEETED